MRHGLDALTEREKETLRLLVAGHDAKSIARHVGLSVHTVNERLRDVRRKLDVSSSREAARLLAEAERHAPEILGDTSLGVPPDAAAPHSTGPMRHPSWAAQRIVWFGGGMIIMSLVIAAASLVATFHGSAAPSAPAASSAAPRTDAAAAAALPGARAWLALVDRQDWDDSWHTAAPMFQSHVTSAQWAALMQPVRQPLGEVRSRTFQSVTAATALPGAPAGRYEILQFRTAFEHKPDAIETVTFAKQADGWKTAGYYIR